MADEDPPKRHGGWLPPSDRQYTPPEREPHHEPALPEPAPDHEPALPEPTPDREPAPPGWQPPAGASRFPGDPPAGGTPGGPSPSGAPALGASSRGATEGSGHVIPTANGKATASLVLGIAGLVVFPLVCSVAALVLGYQSRKEIDASHGRQHNRGSATAGIVTGWFGIIGGILVIVAVLAFGLAGDTSSDGGGVEPRPLGEPSIVLVARLAASIATLL